MAEEYLRKIGKPVLVYENPTKYLPYWFEENNVNETRVWAQQQLPNCVAICFFYFIFCMVGPRVMRDRKPFDLQRPLIAWNFLLALFSMACLCRALPQAVHVLSKPNGFHLFTCTRYPANEPITFWIFLFTLSKVAELVDTVFIVLRKKPLTFLHWFHHLTMVYFTFFMFVEAEPFSSWPAILNASVHSVMYTYYAIMSMGVKLPRFVAMCVTSIQLLQFISALSFNLYTITIYARGGDCIRTPASIQIYSVIGIIYLSLFLRLFYNSYIVGKPKPKVA